MRSEMSKAAKRRHVVGMFSVNNHARRRVARTAAIIASGLLGAFAASQTSAATVYWDGDGLGAQSGGNGLWTTTLPRWTTSGGSSYSAFTSGDTAVFDGTGSAVAVTSGVSGGISVLSNGYIFTGSTTTAVLNWSGEAKVDVAAGVTTELRLAANGTTFNKTGDGKLIFDSSLITNATSSVVNITGGTLQYGRTNTSVANIGVPGVSSNTTGVAQVHMAKGTTLDLGKHWNDQFGSLNDDLGGSGTATVVLGSRQHTWNIFNSGPNFIWGSTLTLNGGNTTTTNPAMLASTFSGNIVSDGLTNPNLPYSGGRLYIGTTAFPATAGLLQADVTLTGTNTFKGITTIAPGATLHVSGGAALPDDMPVNMINDPNSYPLFDLLSDEAVGSIGTSGKGATNPTGGTTGRSVINLNGNKLTIGGDNLNNDFTTATAATDVLQGTSSAIVEKVGTGTQVFNPKVTVGSPLSYSGSWVLKGGKLLFGSAEAMGSGTGASVFTLDGGTLGWYKGGYQQTIPATKGITVTSNGGGFYAMFGANPSLAETIASSITGTGTLTKSGPFGLHLTGDNSGFTGDWRIRDGYLRAGTGFGASPGGLGLGSKVLGTGSINISGGWLEFYTDAAILSTEDQTMSAASATGKSLTYGPGAALFLYRNAANSLTVSVGDAGAGAGSNTGFVRDVANAGTMLLMANSGPAALGTGTGAGANSENLIVPGGVATTSVNGGANRVVPAVLVSTSTSVTEGYFATYDNVAGFKTATMSVGININTANNTDLYAAISTSTNTLSGAASVYGVKIGASGAPTDVNLGTNTLNVGGATASEPGVIILGQGSNINAASGGTIAFGAHEGIIYQETNTGTFTGTVSGTITGTGGITKMGFGTLVLGTSAVTSYTGTTRIEQGMISISNSSQLAGADINFSGTTDASGTQNVGLILNGNTLSVNSINTAVQANYNNNAGGPRIDLGANGVLRVTGSGASVLDACVASSGTTARIHMDGSGTMKLGRPTEAITNDPNGFMSYNQLWVSGGGTIEVPTSQESGSIFSLVLPKVGTVGSILADAYKLGDATTSGTLSFRGLQAAQLGGQNGSNQEGNFVTNYTPLTNRGITIGAGGGTINVDSAYEAINLNSANATFSGGIVGGTPALLTKTGAGVLQLGAKDSVATQDHTTQNWKLNVSGGLVILSSTGGANTTDDLGVVPTALVPDSITLNGGELGTNGQALSLSSFRGITVAASGGVIGAKAAWTINGPLSGTGPLTIASDAAGAGILAFRGASDGSFPGATGTFSGTVTLARTANISAEATNALGIGTITNDPTYPIEFGTANTTTLIQLANTFTINPGAPFDFYVAGVGNLRLNGVISGSGNIYKGLAGNGGTLHLNNAGNSFTGALTILTGAVVPMVDGALGASASPVNVYSLGTLAFSGNVNYTGAKPTSIAGTGTSSAGALQNISGDNTYAGSITLTAPASINTAAGTLTLPAGIVGGPSSPLTTAGTGTLITRSVRTDGLTVSAGNTVIAAQADPTLPASFAGTSKVGALTINASAKLDLTNNKLITSTAVGAWNGSAYSDVTGLIATGRNGGAWNGAGGIITSQSDADSTNLVTTLGVAAASDVLGLAGPATASFAGQTVTSTDTLVMYTYAGDANLDGHIGGDDYFRIDSGYSITATGYASGDFDYNGVIDADDYWLIDRNYSRQYPDIANSPPALGGVSAVPEPASIALLALSAMATLPRRRRSRRA